MEIKRDYGFNELQETCWSGAVDTLNTISKHDKEDEFMQYLEEVFYDDIPTDFVNDFNLKIVGNNAIYPAFSDTKDYLYELFRESLNENIG